MARVYLSPPHLGAEERRFVQEAFDTNWIAPPLGPHVRAFERERTRHTAALSSANRQPPLGTES